MKKRILALILAAVLVIPAALSLSSCTEKYDIVLNVYNWGEYMSIGNDPELLNVPKAFENYYYETYGVRVKVNYDTYTSNEDLRAKLESGAINVDVIIPSDYMIEYFVKHDMLEKLDFSNIPLYSTSIGEGFRNLYYDPTNEYSVPYTYGMVGVIYDANTVKAEDVAAKDWSVMWNPAYHDKIIQFNNPRDAFGTSMYKLGIDVNTTDKAEWDRAAADLKKQFADVSCCYYMDEIFNAMETGEMAVGAYYAGDYFTMRDEQAEGVDLKFYYPEATNLYVDAMCIPKGAKNKTVAERFINFLLSEEAAIANAETTYYASPNKTVYENADYKEYLDDAYDVLYPEGFDFFESYKKYAFRNLSDEMLDYMTSLWNSVKTH